MRRGAWPLGGGRFMCNTTNGDPVFLGKKLRFFIDWPPVTVSCVGWLPDTQPGRPGIRPRHRRRRPCCNAPSAGRPAVDHGYCDPSGMPQDLVGGVGLSLYSWGSTRSGDSPSSRYPFCPVIASFYSHLVSIYAGGHFASNRIWWLFAIPTFCFLTWPRLRLIRACAYVSVSLGWLPRSN